MFIYSIYVVLLQDQLFEGGDGRVGRGIRDRFKNRVGGFIAVGAGRLGIKRLRGEKAEVNTVGKRDIIVRNSP